MCGLTLKSSGGEFGAKISWSKTAAIRGGDAEFLCVRPAWVRTPVPQLQNPEHRDKSKPYALPVVAQKPTKKKKWGEESCLLLTVHLLGQTAPTLSTLRAPSAKYSLI